MIVFIEPGEGVEVRFIKSGTTKDVDTLQLHEGHVYVKFERDKSVSVFPINGESETVLRVKE